jgi:hypothetical protein
VSKAARLRTLEDENRRLKKLLAESMLDVSALKDLLGKTDPVCGALRCGGEAGSRSRLFRASCLQADRGQSVTSFRHRSDLEGDVRGPKNRLGFSTCKLVLDEGDEVSS